MYEATEVAISEAKVVGQVGPFFPGQPHTEVSVSKLHKCIEKVDGCFIVANLGMTMNMKRFLLPKVRWIAPVICLGTSCSKPDVHRRLIT